MNTKHIGICFSLVLLFVPVSSLADWRKIANDVSENIRRADNLGYHEVEIDVKGKSITLMGKVGSLQAKEQIEAIARNTPPVGFVTNKLEVEPSFALRTTNAECCPEMRARLRTELAKYPNFNQNTFNVDLNSNVPTITGSVRSAQDQVILEQVVKKVVGARIVNNLTQIMLPESDAALAERVKDTITRINGVDLTGIEVSAHNGVVSFSGQRENHRQVDQILSLALMVDGVRDLKNEIRLAR